MTEKFAISEPAFNDLAEDFKKQYEKIAEVISSNKISYDSTNYTTLGSTHAMPYKHYYILDVDYKDLHRAMCEPVYKKYGANFYDERLAAGAFDREIKFYDLSREERKIELEKRQREYQELCKKYDVEDHTK